MLRAPDLRAGLLRSIISGLQFRLVLGFALTLALALATVGIFIGLATERQTERFESDHDLARAERVSQFISNHYIEERVWAESGSGVQSIVDQAADISGLRITMFDTEGNIVADSYGPYSSNPSGTR